MTEAKIRINTKNVLCDTEKSLYGLFFEDINHAGDGGIYAELLRNRSFEDGVLPEDCTYTEEGGWRRFITNNGWVCGFPDYHGVAGWEVFGGEMSLNDSDTLNENRTRALDVKLGVGGMLTNVGYNGISVEKGKEYKLMLFIKNLDDKPLNIKAAMVSSEGVAGATQDIVVNESGYQQVKVTLTSDFDDTKGKLGILADDDCAFSLGFSSLFPADTFMGRENGLRKDLVEKLKGLSPKFLRFPGGCIVEGQTRETAMMFKNSIGPIWERKGHYLLWNYRTTLGLGFLEYLQLCEDLDMDALYVCNCGMTCQARNPYFFDEETIAEFIQDTLDALEYAMGDTDTEFGALRAAHGHPAPFKIKYLEIGNENYGKLYHERYEKFYKVLKEKYPELIYVADEHIERNGLECDTVDEHFYSDFDFFVSNHDIYDAYPAKPQVYVGEYACTIGCEDGKLEAALAEAAFLTGIERNQNKVTMLSYAPMFLNVDYPAWTPDMIWFNNHESFGTASYHMLAMFGANRGDKVVETSVETPIMHQNSCGGIAVVHRGEGIWHKDALINGERPLPSKKFDGDIEALENGEYLCKTSGENRLVLGDNSLKDYVAEVWCKADDEGRIVLGFWNKTETGANQNRYNWEIANGVSTVSRNNGWSFENVCGAKCDKLAPNEFHKLSVETSGSTFKLYVNDVLVNEHTIKTLPIVTSVCTIDEATNEAIIKAVNVSDEAIDVKILLDCEIASEIANVTVLTGESKAAVNSFENKTNVAPVNTTVNIAKDDIVYNAPANSVSVIRFKLA